MYKTCKSLEQNLFIAPGEVRSCCQRFFYKGKIRGDAKLLNIIDNKIPTTLDILNARKKMFEEIQKGKKEACQGCIFLSNVKEKPKLTSNISHLSIEHHSVCNLRCSYCSETYYGGKRSKYNVVEFISYLSKNNALKNCNQVVWGGGEPTLDKSFEQILEGIEGHANPKLYHRVFTNSVRYSEAITKFLKKGLIKIVTSIDAGTPETFLKVRGRSKLTNVFENLNTYSKIDPTAVTIKYIFTDENFSENEIDNFILNCKKYNLQDCNYQISVNYKDSKLEFEMLKSVSYLFSKLSSYNFKKIFVDDHLMLRFISLDVKKLDNVKNYLLKKNANKILLDYEKLNDLIIYGAGKIGKEIIKKTNFFKKVKNFDIVDADKNKIGTMLSNKEIKSPSILKNDPRFIYIAVAQSYDEVFKNIIKIQGNSNKILTGLIL